MRYDPTIGWLLTKEDFLEAGFKDYQFKYGRKTGDIPTTSRACKNRQAEIIFNDLLPKTKAILIQRFLQLGQNQQEYLLDAKMSGMEMTEAAISVTAQSIEINIPFIVNELQAYIEKNYHQYLSFYIEHEAIVGRSITGYAKICTLATWLYDMVKKIMHNYESQRDQNRMLRSLRANVLSTLETMSLGVKVPMNDIRFAEWLDNIVFQLNNGLHITEVIKIKREGNFNATRMTLEQENWIANLWINGNAITIMEIYDRMVEVGRFKGWWRNKVTGDYEPVSHVTIYNYIKHNQNQLSYARTDAINYRNRYVAQITREYPTKKNECWGIDGTAHNENVFFKGQAKQYLYATKIYDYASAYLLHNEITVGMDESAFRVIEALKGAIKAAGYLPAYLQYDRGPGNKGLEQFCNEIGITAFPAGTGRARSKLIESLIGQFDGGVKFEKGWSGMNRTAQGPNSHPSDEYFKKGKVLARSMEMASRELRTRLTDQWNNHIIKTREGNYFDKTPAELWNSLESETKPLPYTELAMLTGTKHTIKLNIDGLEVQNSGIKYLYFPQIDTEEQRIKVNEILASIPLYKKESSQCDIYVTAYGSPAPVFYKKRYIGTWTLKSKVPYLAGHHKKTEDLVKFNDLQKIQEESAKNLCQGTKEKMMNSSDAELFEKMASTAYVGRTRVSGKYDKAEFNASEVVEKAGIECADPVALLKNELEPVTQTQFKTLVDPDTGEQYNIPINNL